MTDEELDELVEEKWDEGMGQKWDNEIGYKIAPASVGENCIARELDLDNIPLIDVDVCLVDEPCGIEITLGALGQSTTMGFDDCRTMCQTYEINAFAEILEIEVCNRVPFSEIKISAERCNWRPTRGWDCPNSGKQTIDLPW